MIVFPHNSEFFLAIESLYFLILFFFWILSLAILFPPQNKKDYCDFLSHNSEILLRIMSYYLKMIL